MTLEYAATRPPGQPLVRAATVAQVTDQYQDDLGMAIAKTPGTLVPAPDAPREYVLGIGDGTVAPALHSGRKFVRELPGSTEALAIDVSAYLRPHEPGVRLPQEPLVAFLRGLYLGTYQVDLWKGDRPGPHLPEATLTVVAEGVSGFSESETATRLRAALHEAGALAKGQAAAMHLVDRPANAKRPRDVAQYVTDLGAAHGFEVEVVDAEALEIQGFGGILNVGRASAHPPYLLKLRYGRSGGYHVGFVGKGITFDAGGVSIKDAKNMGFMKSDLGGAAAVLGTFVAVAELGLGVELTGLLGVAENVIDGDAYLPSDVIRNYGGKTIEITDTDAEGRLVMADCLAYLPEIATPDFTIDVATLTGSAVQTFGYEAAALFTHDDAEAEAFAKTGEATGERVWRLPLWEVYDKHLRSDVADVKHFHGLPIAGAINAAKFLEYFAADKTRWMHLDIAPVAFAASDFTVDRAATGYGVTLLTAYLQSKASSKSETDAAA